MDLSRLTSAQRRAVLAGDGPLLVLAGPGSGKTTVLAARVGYLVTARRVPPSSVLAITFTRAAARELRVRLIGLLGDLGSAVDITTFHAFGLRIIRQWSEELGFRSGPLTVYDDSDAERMLGEVAASVGLEHKLLPMGKLAARVTRARLGDGHPRPAEIQSLVQAYEKLLQQRGAVDYPAMLALPHRLFTTQPIVLRLYQDSYRYILCDEFQDLCANQYHLLRQLAKRHRNLLVVGDPCQMLFGWRGADVRFFQEIQRDFPELGVFNLDQNFRSTGRIVRLANRIGRPLPYSHDLWTGNPPGSIPCLAALPDEPAEVGFVADEIARLQAAGAIDHLGEVAVLYRTNRQAEALTVALRTRQLPYRVRGHADLFARRAVRDAVAYLRLAQNPADSAALARVVNVPPRRLGRLAAELQADLISAADLPARADRFGPRASAAAQELVQLLDNLHARRTTRDVRALLDLALERSGYRAWLARQRDAEAQLQALTVLRDLATEAATDLATWLADLQLGEDVHLAAHEAGHVLLTTIHGAKGGEWRVVFVVGVEEGLLPHKRSTRSGAAAVDGLVAERRVAYVAVTRPRERLYLTACQTRTRAGHSIPTRVSRFVAGLPADLLRRGD